MAGEPVFHVRLLADGEIDVVVITGTGRNERNPIAVVGELDARLFVGFLAFSQ
ncbi:hypothetical protein [Bifidobacterium olomucense]|uniref:hypothetical protein n=1 Tax=Bifidobacterium olomucense TaxID=2675324 RepID=UPI00145D9751|nr:hypothetical protein [Bifidobacterium sp. DSM 109959]